MQEQDGISKQWIRSKYLDIRDQLTTKERQEKSRQIWERLKEEAVFDKAQAVLVYMDYRSEVMTTGLVEELLAEGEKIVYTPRVSGMDIHFYEIRSMEDLERGYQGIREPKEDISRLFNKLTVSERNCLVLVPGTAYDRGRNRLGYGKGFFDRFLEKYPTVASIALAFDCQIAKRIPAEAHDRKPDMIITESGVIR